MPDLQKPVLIVDDDPAVRDALRFALEAEGMTVRLFGSGRAVLDATDLAEAGCLIIDYSMPDMDGIELVALLRDREVALPMILISGRIGRDLRRRADAQGIETTLEKPLSDDALLRALRSVLGPPSVEP